MESVNCKKYIDVGYLGIADTSMPAKMVGKFVGNRCVILGGARCVWDDLALLGIHGGDSHGTHIMAVNDIVMHYPGRVRHLYSNDHRIFPFWLGARRVQISRKYGGVDHTHSCRTGGQFSWPWPGHGTSVMGASYTALALGYDPVVICGAPLDNSGHYFEPPWTQSNFNNEIPETTQGTLAYWHDANKNCFKGRVKSMSGRTRELLGAP